MKFLEPSPDQPFHRLLPFLSGLLTLGLGLALFFRELLMRPSGSFLWVDNFDPSFIYWTVNWGYHILFEKLNPAGFYNANSFYPQPLTLAYSDSMLGIQLFFAPLRILGIAALPALYLSIALTILAAGLLTIAALRRIEEFSPLEIAFILFGAFFSLPVTGYLTHYQLFGFYFIVPFVLYLFLYLRDAKLNDQILVCVLYALGISYAMYLAPILLVLGAGLVVVMLLLQLEKRLLWKDKTIYLAAFTKRSHLITALVFILLTFFLLVRPYLTVSDQVSSNSIERVILFSAPIGALFTNASAQSLWYKAGNPAPGSWESAYFPGIVLLTLALAYVLLRLRLYRMQCSQNAACQKKPAGSNTDTFTVYMFVFLTISLVLSFGPYLKTDQQSAYPIPMPYYFLAKVVPGLEQMRAPGRFGMFIGLPLAYVGVQAVRHLKDLVKGTGWVLFLLFGLLVIESVPDFKVFPFSPDPDGRYSWLAKHISPGSALLELPLSDNGEQKNWYATQQLTGSTFHWAKIAAGYGAKETLEYRILFDADVRLQSSDIPIGEIWGLAQKYNFDHVLISLDNYPASVQAEWQKLAQECQYWSMYPPSHALLIRVSSCPSE